MQVTAKVSVITVCYNDASNLEKTIKSVLEQNYANLEFVVVDGGSKDGTIELIKKYEQSIDLWVSEPDKGIYNAMNKGIKMATGKWLNFMNAGDLFAGPSTLSQIPFEASAKSGIIYGQTIRENAYISHPMDIDSSLKIGHIMACHQSMFFNKDILTEELYYAEKYVLVDDYDLVSRIYNKGYDCKSVALPIANFLGGGATTDRDFSARLGHYKAITHNFGFMALLQSVLRRLVGKKSPKVKMEKLVRQDISTA